MPYYLHSKDTAPILAPDVPDSAKYELQQNEIAIGATGAPCLRCARLFVANEPIVYVNPASITGEYYMPYVCQACADAIRNPPEVPANVSPMFSTRADAFRTLKDRYSEKTHTITFIASQSELNAWRERERNRFRSHEYLPVPWPQYGMMSTDHYTHLSLDKSGMVAYTPDAEHGVLDKQIRLTPGRYLERFYTDYFTREDIARYVTEVTGTHAEYQIADTVADVRLVYRNGPASCMGGPVSHTNQYWKEHHLDSHMPAEVYAKPGDLAVAYYGPKDHPSQRCVIWPAKKRYVRIYGTGPLEHLLKRDGYTKGTDDSYGSVVGARVPKIKLSNNGYLMPYVDGVGYVDDAPDDSPFFVFVEDDGYGCNETCGYIAAGNRLSRQYDDEDEDENEDEDEDNGRTCDHCGTYYTPGEDGGTVYCESCLDERSGCTHCGTDIWDGEGSRTEDGDIYCDACYRDLQTECSHDGCRRRWIEDEDFILEERAIRERHNLTDVCRAHFEQYEHCQACDTMYYPPDDCADGSIACPDCGREPRCDRTLDLPLKTHADITMEAIAVADTAATETELESAF